MAYELTYHDGTITHLPTAEEAVEAITDYYTDTTQGRALVMVEIDHGVDACVMVNGQAFIVSAESV